MARTQKYTACLSLFWATAGFQIMNPIVKHVFYQAGPVTSLSSVVGHNLKTMIQFYKIMLLVAVSLTLETVTCVDLETTTKSCVVGKENLQGDSKLLSEFSWSIIYKPEIIK
jgi:hypothetical protein